MILMNKVAFVGHRDVLDIYLRKKLYHIVENQILDGNYCFIMGTHGEFDEIALEVCRDLKKIYDFIKIEVVLTSLSPLKKKVYDGDKITLLSTFKKQHPNYEEDDFRHLEIFATYDNVETKMYDIGHEHYKNRITKSNRRMIDESDIVICYVDMKRTHSGAKTTLNYAQKKGLKTINLFEELF